MADAVPSRRVSSAAPAPADTFDGRYFRTTVAWARAWENVRTEQVREFRHLTVYLTDSRPDITDALERMNKGSHDYLTLNAGRR